jgi:predicted lipoprotein with Yx(FWY)xxD motif
MNAKQLPVALGLLAAATLAVAIEVPIRQSGGVLVDENGKTLYTYDKDGAGKSACNGPCAAAWPPAKASAKAKARGDYGVVTRDDGSRQWSYKGKALYTYAKDKNPGDKTGDGADGGWRVAK